MAFLFLTIHHPKPEHRDEVLLSMERVGEVMRGAPGLLQIGPWKEQEGNRLFGIAIWESREAFDRALEQFSSAARAGASGHDWNEGPTEEIFAEQAAWPT